MNASKRLAHALSVVSMAILLVALAPAPPAQASPATCLINGATSSSDDCYIGGIVCLRAVGDGSAVATHWEYTVILLETNAPEAKCAPVEAETGGGDGDDGDNGGDPPEGPPE